MCFPEVFTSTFDQVPFLISSLGMPLPQCPHERMAVVLLFLPSWNFLSQKLNLTKSLPFSPPPFPGFILQIDSFHIVWKMATNSLILETRRERITIIIIFVSLFHSQNPRENTDGPCLGHVPSHR